ncbi:hypothetical protein JDV02_006103 [Purpureocillium takamizusanense]|uniref:Secreted protein n=1 Tax=Purpureocillium takamizusanense TaxID=2060973 RepID=A0A9Q8QIU7_9HYPO|nr:uncharacterized protein JDV02_006103 [Purpureocillium takamizusanense]UNI19961.1 hypothetical protein JDV02_006103 [Purpureocillium takamizusanense]
MAQRHGAGWGWAWLGISLAQSREGESRCVLVQRGVRLDVEWEAMMKRGKACGRNQFPKGSHRLTDREERIRETSHERQGFETKTTPRTGPHKVRKAEGGDCGK